MRRSKHRLAAFVVGLAVMATGCRAPLDGVNIFGPTSPPYRVRGEVIDDSLYLPPGESVKVTVGGVRVEVLEGPDKGRFAITNASGGYDLGELSSDTRIRATKDGWEPAETVIDGYTWPSPFLSISTPPHCVWGHVYLPGEPTIQVPAAGVRVEIVGGPDAGQFVMSDDRGLYSFSNLATQPALVIEFSKAGYRTDRFPQGEVKRNQQRPWRLTAQ